VNLVTLTTVLPPPIYSTARRGATSHVIRLGVPDQDARLGPRHGCRPKFGGDQTNILPLDLSSLSSFFNFLLKISIHIFFLPSFLFHHRLVHRTVSSSAISVARLTATIYFSILKWYFLWALCCPKNIGYTINSCRLCVLWTHWVVSLYKQICKYLLFLLIHSKAFKKNSGLSPSQRLTSYQCVWQHTWPVVVGVNHFKW
jgi:hypothetical protein